MSTLHPTSAGTSSTRASTSTYACLGIMVLLWGASWPVTKLALNEIPPLWLAATRFGSAALCLFCYLAATGQIKLPTRRDLPIVLSTGLLQMMTFTGLGMIAMVHVDTSRAVLLAYTTPLWCVLVSSLVFRDLPGRMQLLALAMGIAGIAVVCSPSELDWASEETMVGAALLLIGAICWAVVVLHVKQHKWDTPPLKLAPWQMLMATIPLGIFAYHFEGTPSSIELTPSLLEMLVFIGPIATSACFVISAEYGRRISTFEMSNFTLGVPLIGIASSQFVLGLKATPLFITGLVMVLMGVVLTALAARRTASAA